MKIIKLTFILLILCMLFTSCNKDVADERDLLFIEDFYTNYNSNEFDASNIVLSFGALSDIHIGADNQVTKLSNALNILSKRAKFGIDAFLFAGDLTNTSGHTKTNDEIKTFRDTVKKHLKKETAVIYCLGVNHDHTTEEIDTQRALFEKSLGKRFFSHDVTDSASLHKGMRHSIVSGYDFISLDFDNGSYSDSKLTWIDDTLKVIIEKNPDKPVFVTVHMPPSGKLQDVLNKYPQVICFSGHSHLPINTNMSIKQTNYTQLHCGGLYYYRQFTHENDAVIDMGDIYKFAQGYLVEVDINNNVRLIRLDFNNRSHYTPEWIIGSPKKDKSHLYHIDQNKNTDKPFFNEGAKISFDDSMTYTLAGSFDSASSSINPIEYYMVNFWNKNGDSIKHEVKYISSQYALYNINNMPEKYEFTFFRKEGEYAISVTAFDSFGSSKSLFSNSGLYCVNIEKSVANIYINNAKTNYAAFLPGETVTIKVTPPYGYKYDILVDNVTLTNNSFKMPNYNVEINVILKKI